MPYLPAGYRQPEDDAPYEAEPVPQPGLGGTPMPPPDPPPVPAPVPAEGLRPGPPQNYVPGSTYIPASPRPYESQPPPVAPHLVPGSGAYHPEQRPRDPSIPPLVPGLGGMGVPDRPAAPNDPLVWDTVNPSEPQLPVPGSTYVPHYIGRPPIGDPRAVWVDPIPSRVMGRPTEPGQAVRPTGLMTTTYPASGAPETMRHDPTHDVLGDNPDMPRLRPPRGPLPESAADLFLAMELGRLARADPRSFASLLRGLFGGNP